MTHVEIVNIEEAQYIIQLMARKVEQPEVRPLLDQLDEDMKSFIHSMILTAIHTGLIEDRPERLGELRLKLIMAMDSGFVLGRERG